MVMAKKQKTTVLTSVATALLSAALFVVVIAAGIKIVVSHQ